jgi:hypothetical protein
VRNPQFSKEIGMVGLDYYYQAVSLLRERHSDVTLYVFSDDIDAVEREFKPAGPHVFVRATQPWHAYDKIRLMSLCQHAIIANSTFSWWGAWLNPSPDKMVIAPDPWFAGGQQDGRDLVPAGWRPVLHVEKAPRRDPRLVVVQNSCSGARYSATTKEWPQSSWRELVRRLAGRSWIVQIGSPSDPPLDAAEDLRGRTTLREAATLLSGAASFVGLESGLQHVAAAMHTPSVIIYGGRSRPCETGYPFNHNITRSPACAGCGLNTGCPHGMLCMEIPVEEVAAAVNGVIVPNAPV